MQVTVSPSSLNGFVVLPSSKSVTQRAYILALLFPGKTIIKNSGKSKDEKSALEAIQKLGAKVQCNKNEMVIQGVDTINYSGEIFCGESGLLLRLLTMLGASLSQEITLTGNGSLAKRDVSFFEKYLTTLGVAVTTNDGKIPVTVRGPMRIENMEIDGSNSSQYLSGLLIAVANQAKEKIIIKTHHAVSKPYLDITMDMMKLFGNNISSEAGSFIITPAKKNTDDIICTVDGDWSNGAFLLVASVIAGEITIKGLNPDSLQGDKKLMHILAYCGVNFTVDKESIYVHKPHFLYAFMYDATDTPDLFPPLVALACNCNGLTIIKGVHRLINKESNRALTLVNVFRSLGADISIKDDEMYIHGSLLKGGIVDSHNDHRIAMAVAVAALTCEQPVTIQNAEAVDKSYPDFFKDIQSIGAKISFTV